MKLDPGLEEKIKSKAISYLKTGRHGFDIPHTMASVYWMQQLLIKEKGNPKILVSAMYLHDVGYANKLPKGHSYEQCLQAKKDHMIHGAEIARKILEKVGQFTKEEIDEIENLVKTHDIIDRDRNHHEQLVFEADTLGQVDRDRAKPSFDKANYQKWLAGVEKARIPQLKTKSGIKFLNQIIQIARDYYK